VHTIFRQPRSIKQLVTRAVREALAVARRATRHGADEVLEEGGTRIFRQATGARGKFRTVIEHDMGREIGTRGERILRIVIDQSGRIVTAFPPAGQDGAGFPGRRRRAGGLSSRA
jgi:hypothetical protein